MTEQFAKVGNNIIVGNKEFNEAQTFDKFGNKVGEVTGFGMVITRGAATLVDIDLVSLLGVGEKQTEVYCKGKVALVEDDYINIFNKLWKNYPKAYHQPLRFAHKEVKGMPILQIITLFQKNCVTLESLENLLSISEWVML